MRPSTAIQAAQPACNLPTLPLAQILFVIYRVVDTLLSYSFQLGHLMEDVLRSVRVEQQQLEVARRGVHAALQSITGEERPPWDSNL